MVNFSTHQFVYIESSNYFSHLGFAVSHQVEKIPKVSTTNGTVERGRDCDAVGRAGGRESEAAG